MLEELELQRQRPLGAESAGGQVEDRRPADMAGDAGMGGADRFAGYWQGHEGPVTSTQAQIAMGIPCASRPGRAGKLSASPRASRSATQAQAQASMKSSMPTPDGGLWSRKASA